MYPLSVCTSTPASLCPAPSCVCGTSSELLFCLQNTLVFCSHLLSIVNFLLLYQQISSLSNRSTPTFLSISINFNMCRWFAYISPEEPCLLADVLLTPANAISKQCSEHYLPKLLPHGEETELDDGDKLLQMRNSLLNMDGLGIAVNSTIQFSDLKLKLD